ncbi:MAG TPA: hypothetical protein DCO75_04125 [Fibrobacteres bacterium]|nr:hypothetical protein [Fibrobacterota bacterium]
MSICPPFSSCTTAPAIGVVPLVSVTVPLIFAIQSEAPKSPASNALTKGIITSGLLIIYKKNISFLDLFGILSSRTNISFCLQTGRIDANSLLGILYQITKHHLTIYPICIIVIFIRLRCQLKFTFTKIQTRYRATGICYVLYACMRINSGYFTSYM